MQLEPSPGTWLLDSHRGSSVYQLERELKAAHLALKTFPIPVNSTVMIRTDNTTSLSYINKQGGTRSLPLINLATEVWNWCIDNQIMIQAQHIQGLNNTIADLESRRTFFKNQWKLLPTVFQQINRLWGPLTVDLFADRTTNPFPRYVSWLPDPDACVHHDMKESRTAIRKSTLEPNIPGASEDPPGTNSVHSSRSPVLAECHMVPHGESSLSLPSSNSGQTSSTNNLPNDRASLTTEQLDTLRLEVIRNRINALGLNTTATKDLLQQHIRPSATLKCYRKHQLRFLDYAVKNQVLYDRFMPQDVVNFLSTMRDTQHHQTTTLKTARAAITLFMSILISFKEVY